MELPWQMELTAVSYTHLDVYKRQDIDTGGHVFQIVVSNMQSMSDVAYYSGSKSGVFLGFNMYSCLLYTSRCV